MNLGATRGTELVGLTEKGLKLDFAMRAAFHEFFVEARTGRGRTTFTVEPGVEGAVNRRFDGLWRAAGLERSVVKTEILGLLAAEPKSLGALKSAVRRNVRSARGFEEAVEEMERAGLVTTDPDLMWME